MRAGVRHRLPEIAVRAVADLVGLPNWDWVGPRDASRGAAHGPAPDPAPVPP